MARFTVNKEEMSGLATLMYKHQLYKPSVAVKKIHTSFADPTVSNYFNAMKNYLKDGRVNPKIPAYLYEAIQVCKDTHVGILTPSDEERYVPYNKPNRQVKTPVKITRIDETDTSVKNSTKININPETLKTIQNVGKISCVGIKVSNGIKLFDNESVMDGYIQCLQDLSGQIEDLKWEVVELSYKVKN